MADTPRIRLKAGDFRELSSLIADKFPDPSRLTYELGQLGEPLDGISAGGEYGKVIYDVVQYFDRRDKVRQLIEGLMSAAPRRRDLEKFAARFGIHPRGDVATTTSTALVDAPGLFMDRESWYARRAAFESTLCRIESTGDRGDQAVGLLVGKDAILTVWSSSARSGGLKSYQCIIHYSTETDEQGKAVATRAERQACQVLAAGRPGELNYVLLRDDAEPGDELIGTPSGGMKRGWLALDTHDELTDDMGLYLWKYAEDGRLQSLYLEHAVEQIHGKQFVHRHLEAKSPGAPLVRSDWAILGLHGGLAPDGRGIGLQIRAILADLGRKGVERFGGFEP